MSVTDVKDQYQDLFAITEAARNNQTRAKDEETDANGEGGETSVLETRFSELLRGRLSSNIVFTRLDQTLNLPQRVVGERDQSAVVDRRDEIAGNDDVDQFDPTDSLEDPTRTAPVVHNDAPIEQPTQVRTDDAPRADAAAVRDSGRGQAQATNSAADRAAQRSVASETMQAEEVPEEMAALARNAAKNGDKKLNATVTNEQARIASTPQASLSAKAAVDAAAGTRRGAAAEIQAQAMADGEETAAAEEGANNIFNRIKANASTAAGAAGRAGSNTQAGDANGQGAGTAQANANPNAQFAANLARVSTGTTTSSLTGTAQSGVTVDGASGATATLGQNNSIQSRSTPAPTATANRPPPVPAHVVADQVAVNIQKGIAQGQDKITVNLRPQELGRVEIKMEVGHDGKLTAVVAAERPETLDMLRQDSRSLIQTLGEAGLQADENSLSFTLQGDNAGGDQQASSGGGNGGAEEGDLSDKLIETGFVFEETGGFDGDGRLDVRI